MLIWEQSRHWFCGAPLMQQSQRCHSSNLSYSSPYKEPAVTVWWVLSTRTCLQNCRGEKRRHNIRDYLNCRDPLQSPPLFMTGYMSFYSKVVYNLGDKHHWSQANKNFVCSNHVSLCHFTKNSVVRYLKMGQRDIKVIWYHGTNHNYFVSLTVMQNGNGGRGKVSYQSRILPQRIHLHRLNWGLFCLFPPHHFWSHSATLYPKFPHAFFKKNLYSIQAGSG